ncbi:MAG: four helix bundle protein [Planctomycetia bacterium]|nr:four helix bundle protein [Planctomycetia bacterium]
MAPETRRAPVRSYRDLVVWQRAMTLAEGVYAATRKFPKEEIYGLTSQMRRAAVSVASNIAEGQARPGRGELLQFLGYAAGSLAELGTQVTLAARFDLFAPGIEQSLTDLIAEVGRLLNGLRNSLKPERMAQRSLAASTTTERDH